MAPVLSGTLLPLVMRCDPNFTFFEILSQRRRLTFFFVHFWIRAPYRLGRTRLANGIAVQINVGRYFAFVPFLPFLEASPLKNSP